MTDDSNLITFRPRRQSPDTRLRKARLAKKFSQADLAVVSGVSVSWVSMLERKPELMSPSVAERLARALGVPAADLLPEASVLTADPASGPGLCLSTPTPPTLAGAPPEGGRR